jgi:chemotaxis protein CheD
MAQVVVGISDCRVSVDTAATLVTYALGSCIAVMLYDPVRKVGGMLHFMLPESSLDRNKAAANPFMFADTGIPTLLEQIRACGSDGKRLQVRLAGGAQVLDPQNVFAIGRRNYLAARKELWKFGLLVSGEAVGGELSRTVRLSVDSGKSWLREGGNAEVEFVSTVRAPLPQVAAIAAAGANRKQVELRGGRV